MPTPREDHPDPASTGPTEPTEPAEPAEPAASAGAPRARPAITPRQLIAVGLGVLVVAILAVAALTGTSSTPSGDRRGPKPAAGPHTPATPSPGAVPTIAGPRPPPLDATLLLGRPTAPVTIVEFGDFQCPNCGRFARETKPTLIRKYVDTGVVRLAWRDFPTFGKQSKTAAVAARAAARQGRFWQFHDALYGRRLPPRSGRLTSDYLRSVAEQAELDLARYDADVRDSALRAAVADDFAFGQRLGVPGTPAFLINGEAFFGAQPLRAFEEAIARARAER